MGFELAKVDKVFFDFREQIKKAKEINEQTVFDYEDKKGNKEARSHIYKLRQSRTAIEKVRKAEKAESLAYGKELDSVAKSLMAELTEMIEVHESPIKAIEEKEQAVKAQIWKIAGSKDLEFLESNSFLAEIKVIEDIVITVETFGDLAEDAEFERFKTIKVLKGKFLKLQEAELTIVKQQEAEKKEADRLQVEANKRAEIDRKERERQIKQQAEADAEEKAKQQAIRVESDKANALAKAELDKQVAVEKAQREAQAKIDDEAKRIANKQRADELEIKVLADQEKARSEDKEHRRTINAGILYQFEMTGCDKGIAKVIIGQISKGNISNIQINY